MDIFRNGKVQLLIMASVIVLSITAEKCRQLTSVESPSRTRTEGFQYLNCFDNGYGTAVCAAKGTMKFYMFMKYDIDRVIKHGATPRTDQDSTFLVKHYMGAIVSSGWDLFETIYFGGTLAEGFSKGTGTFFGTSFGGIIGALQLGRFLSERLGFLVGSHIGAWFGGRMGLMAYDVVHGVRYFYL